MGHHARRNYKQSYDAAVAVVAKLALEGKRDSAISRTLHAGGYATKSGRGVWNSAMVGLLRRGGWGFEFKS